MTPCCSDSVGKRCRLIAGTLINAVSWIMLLASHRKVTSGTNRAEGTDDVCRWLSHVRSKGTGPLDRPQKVFKRRAGL
jgi:hypothetical protein